MQNEPRLVAHVIGLPVPAAADPLAEEVTDARAVGALGGQGVNTSEAWSES